MQNCYLHKQHRVRIGQFVHLLFLTNLFRDNKVQWYTDSQNVVYILRKGSMIVEILELALKVHFLLKDNRIRMSTAWIPRGENELADFYSRVTEHIVKAINIKVIFF